MNPKPLIPQVRSELTGRNDCRESGWKNPVMNHTQITHS